MNNKPNLSFWHIWNMCFGFLGIQFGFSLQNANTSRIFQTLGASMDELPILWVAAPITGLLVQPIIGYMSDRTWNRLGRRRPFFVAGAILASVALIFMPNSPTLWIAAGTLWVMDASFNIAMEPFRAFVGDMLNEKQRPSGYAMQSFFIGIGATVASALPWMLSNWADVPNTAPEGSLPNTVIYSFYFGAAVLLLSILWTVFSSREYSPQQLRDFESAEGQPSEPEQAEGLTAASYLKQGAGCLAFGSLAAAAIMFWQLEKELYVLAVATAVFGLIQLWVARVKFSGAAPGMITQMSDDLFSMPSTMKQLARVQFFSWFAFFAWWIYSIPAVSSFHFNSVDPTSQAYNEGANWGGLLNAAYNVFAALAAIAIPFLVARIGSQKTHSLNLALGGLALLSIILIDNPSWLMLPMVGLGFAWASLVSMPYVMLAGALPAGKMGVYMGIFNFFIVIPQILAASILGFMLKIFFDNQPIYAMMIGGISLLIAALLSLRVKVPS